MNRLWWKRLRRRAVGFNNRWDYGCDWADRRLYQLCVNSTLGLDASAKLIVSAVRSSETEQQPEREETPALRARPAMLLV